VVGLLLRGARQQLRQRSVGQRHLGSLLARFVAGPAATA
jgi:hypothetical protein